MKKRILVVDDDAMNLMLTKRILEAGRIIGVELLDHIIIGNNCYVSLREEGILEKG